MKVAIRDMFMTLENTKVEGGEVFYEDDAFGWIGDRNNFFTADYPIPKGTIMSVVFFNKEVLSCIFVFFSL